jgi:hypothetical protein
LDYPAAGGCPSLLVEPAATNLLLRSEEFNDASWSSLNATVTANATTAPNGALTADKIIPIAAGISRVQQAITWTGERTFSVFAKAAEFNEITLIDGASATRIALFNLTNGTIVSQGTQTTARITPLSDGYYRCSVTWPEATTGCTVRIGGGTASGTNGLFLWGAQLETGSVATSYIPTTAATATRNADVISKTGVSGFIGQAEGCLYAEVDVRNWNSGDRILGISDGTTENSVALLKGTATNTLRLISRLSNVLQVTIQSSAISGTIFKIAAAYALNDFVLYVNGVQIGTSASASVPACSAVFLGKVEGAATTQGLNDRIRAAAIYTTRLSNSELASLTSL